MLKIENVEVVGWEHAIRGMRNPKNSWDRSDTVFVPDTPRLDYHGNVVEIIPAHYTNIHKPVDESDSFVCEFGKSPDEIDEECNKKCAYHGECDISDNEPHFVLGTNDHKLMMSLSKGGPVHAKYRRFIVVYLDIIAPLYWWKEFDTYKVGTVANSCSTMHKIHSKPIEVSDFSVEDLGTGEYLRFEQYVKLLEDTRCEYLENNDKHEWRMLIQLLPSSYNQRRTIILNYEVLTGIYEHRKDHKLDEWHVFCDWIKSLPYSEIITGET